MSLWPAGFSSVGFFCLGGFGVVFCFGFSFWVSWQFLPLAGLLLCVLFLSFWVGVFWFQCFVCPSGSYFNKNNFAVSKKTLLPDLLILLIFIYLNLAMEALMFSILMKTNFH